MSLPIVSNTAEMEKIDFREGSVLLVDKPLHWTSFDVVNKVRFAIKHLYGIKKIKVGHAGTLDPLATGLLILCTGKLTKQIDTLQGMDKSYTGTLKLGATTPSYDAESDPDVHYPVDHISEEMLNGTLDQFRGAIEQVPPIYSAIKMKGVAAYRLARRGDSVEMKKRTIHIFDLKIDSKNFPDIDFSMSCSKGTYVRSFAHDYGKALGSGAYLTDLRRTAIGEYSVENAWNLENLVKEIQNKVVVK